ncbi:MAG: S-adenosylmethionine:tRNA ribosyltransferase-isomerase [Gaiellaceae bacterium]
MSALASPVRQEAHEPPEARGLGRDDVAMLVATRHDLELVHARFRELPRFLSDGDLFVVNTSATLPAALKARLGDEQVQLWLSTPEPDGTWLVELRTGEQARYPRQPLGARLDLPGGGQAELLASFVGSERLLVARLELDEPLEGYLRRHGRPIRYRYVPEPWPLEAYQTVFALQSGSAEMPSAGRPFTSELVTELVTRGVLVAPVTLHTGVSSLEQGEPAFPERFQVPSATARLVNAVHAWNGRVIAVGTTVVRALETVAAADGTVSGGRGWTSLVVTPERGLLTIDGLLTGWHEPKSSHLQLLEAAAGVELLNRSYRAAHEHGYLWHEFGDLHLILP